MAAAWVPVFAMQGLAAGWAGARELIVKAQGVAVLALVASMEMCQCGLSGFHSAVPAKDVAQLQDSRRVVIEEAEEVGIEVISSLQDCICTGAPSFHQQSFLAFFPIEPAVHVLNERAFELLIEGLFLQGGRIYAHEAHHDSNVAFLAGVLAAELLPHSSFVIFPECCRKVPGQGRSWSHQQHFKHSGPNHGFASVALVLLISWRQKKPDQFDNGIGCFQALPRYPQIHHVLLKAPFPHFRWHELVGGGCVADECETA